MNENNTPPKTGTTSADAVVDVRAAIERLRAALVVLELTLEPTSSTPAPLPAPAAPEPAPPALEAPVWKPADEVAPPAAPATAPVAQQGWGGWSQGGSLSESGWPGGHKTSSNAEAAAVQPSEPAEDAGTREQVRLAVEQLKVEIAAAMDGAGETAEAENAAVETGADETEGEEGSDEQTPDLVALEAPSEAASADAEELARDEVRRAVESTRAELGLAEPGRIVDIATFAREGDGSGRIPTLEPLLNERFLAPASLVIDDPQGRVELVRVFRTLARLDCAATASLGNYSSHSVTVQLEERDPPSETEIEDAVRYAFERECTVELDGNRVTVRLSAAA